MVRVFSPAKKVFDGQTTTGWSKSLPVTDFKNVIIALVVTGTGTASVKPAVGISTGAGNIPTFSTSAGVDNLWSYCSFSDVDDQTPVDGSTGLSITTAGTYILEANVDGADFAAIHLSAVSGLTITSYIKGYTND